MKGYPLHIKNIDALEDGQTVRCIGEQSDIQEGQFFVESRPNESGLCTRVVPVFQLIEDRQEKTMASLVLHHSRIVLRKL